ncbi:MAG TPA: hypothetical protein VMW50_00670 [Dehalococcoidia bacterium]|nr:hypothetical protein [Dehalococcoidia bacterium]
MRELILMWVGGIAWLSLGVFLLNRTYNAIDMKLWQTALGYAMGGIILLGGLIFTGIAIWFTWSVHRD